MNDSVSLGAEVRHASGGGLTFKQGGLLLAVLLFVLSDLFLNNFACFIPGAVVGREPTDVGYLVQATMGVIFYAVILYLCDEGVL
jgi:hypothetical protein